MPIALLALPLAAPYADFLPWYDGRGQPLRSDETEPMLRQFPQRAGEAEQQRLLAQSRILLANEDGNKFVMQNLARYRAKALYPPDHALDDDSRAATSWAAWTP